MSGIIVQNLRKKYKKADDFAVDGVTFEVKPGEFFAFLGPNGAGKTTTISILTTTLSKTSGDVQVAGYDIDKHAHQIRQKVGIIFQKPSLDENLTAEENVRLHVGLYQVYKFAPLFSLMSPGYKARVMELAEILGIKDDINKPIKTFSGGMKRKLEIVRSLIHNPEVLFLDEPTTGLDPEARRNLWDYLQQVRRENNTTIFLTTHYLDEVEDADRVSIINKGKIAASGTPEKLKERLTAERLILKTKQREKLLKELMALGLDPRKDSAEKVSIEVEQVNIVNIIKKLKTEITDVETRKATMEDAYLKIISQ